MCIVLNEKLQFVLLFRFHREINVQNMNEKWSNSVYGLKEHAYAKGRRQWLAVFQPGNVDWKIARCHAARHLSTTTFLRVRGEAEGTHYWRTCKMRTDENVILLCYVISLITSYTFFHIYFFITLKTVSIFSAKNCVVFKKELFNVLTN